MSNSVNLIEQDAKARSDALNPAHSFIVQAPAGSGKTELLIQRYLTLLGQVKQPEEILAMTFTKKAANEMRFRVLKALKIAETEPEPEQIHLKNTYQLAKKVLARDQQFQWKILQNPNQLRIQTIDALCAYLTKHLPLLSNFGSAPAFCDHPALLYQEAVREVLLHVEKDYQWSEDVAQLLLHLDNDLNKLQDLLVKLLAKRDQWLPYIHFDTTDNAIKVQLEHQLKMVIEDYLNSLDQIFPEAIIPELISCLHYAIGHLSQSHPGHEILRCRELMSLPLTNADDLPAWRGLASLLLTKEGEWRKSFNVNLGFPAASSSKNAAEKAEFTAFKKKIEAVVEFLKDYEHVKLSLSELTTLPNPTFQDSQWRILKSLLHVLKIVAAQLKVTFQQAGQIDFIENAQAALLALGNDENPTDLALSLDYQIRHILIDEFQDTSLTQYQLIEKLITGWEPNDGRTLFVVGDPMQSIYRFREAEVGLFIRMRSDGIGQVKLTPITLAVNFRSTPTIVDWCNRSFSSIFPDFSDIATGAVNYSPSASKQNTSSSDTSSITLHGFMKEDSEAQANEIIHIIQQEKSAHPENNIAILVRSRTHLRDIIQTLKTANISYHAVDIDPLATRPHIQDLLSLTRALLHPADKIAWLAILRAPWCGLSLAELLALVDDHPKATVWELLSKAKPTARLQHFINIMTQQIQYRERQDLRAWVENTWLLLGGAACLNSEDDYQDVEAFFSLLQSGISLTILNEKMKKLYASTNHDHAALQIMTIHTAKGLEFDTVILPHLERKAPLDDKPLLLWMERPLSNDKKALLLAPICASHEDNDPIFQFITRQQRIKSDYEINRLLYVAATRAKKRLHLLFNFEKNEDGEFKTDSGSFLRSLWPVIHADANKFIHQNSENLSSSNTLTTQPLKKLSPEWQNAIKEQFQVRDATDVNQQHFEITNHTLRILGIITHKLLQLISQFGHHWWAEKSLEQRKIYIKQQALQLAANLDAIHQIEEQVLLAINNTLSDQRGQWILKNHPDAQSELPLSAMIDNKLTQVVIDRTFIDEQNTRWIIDYKTAALTEEEKQKHVKKMRLYAQIMQLHDPRPIRTALFSPMELDWQEIAIL